MKDQFQSVEALRVRFPPFIDKTPGEEIIGTDTCSVFYKKPNGTTDSASATWDDYIEIWTLDLAIGVYMQGEWAFKATSDDPNARAQRKVLMWGDYVENLDETVASRATQDQILSDATPFPGADVALIEAKTTALPAIPASQGDVTDARDSVMGVDDRDLTGIQDLIGAPTTTLTAEVSAAKTAAEGAETQATAAAALSLIVRKMVANGWKVQGTQLIVYDDDGVSIYKLFDLKDDSGNPSGTRVFQRVPV